MHQNRAFIAKYFPRVRDYFICDGSIDKRLRLLHVFNFLKWRYKYISKAKFSVFRNQALGKQLKQATVFDR